MFGMVVRGIVLAIVGSALLGSSALATNGNLWHSNQEFPVTVSDSASYPTNQFWMAGCTLSWSPVMQKDGTTLRERICVFHGSQLSMGSYTDADRQRYYVMKIGTDTVYRQIANIDGYKGRVFLRPADDTLIVQFPGPQYATSPRFSLFSLANNAFTPEMSDVGFSVWRYSLDRSKADTLMGLEVPDGSVYNPAHNGYTFSPNRQYLLARMEDNAVIVANTTTGDMKAIDVMKSGGIVDFAVSDDGSYATFGTSGRIWHTEGCGDRYDYDFHLYAKRQSRTPFANACDMTIVYDEINPPGRFGTWGAIFYFSDNNTTLSFDYPRENPKYHGKIMTEAYYPEQLDYLALGDSYSSGEGDFSIETDSNQFMPYTDTLGPPRENCHLSKASYPYLLRDIYGIDSSMMKSVACSGAMTTDITANLSDYHGQNDRLIDIQDEDVYQATALERFIPGRIPQIEFVRTYKPKVITIGIGGNDAGFADELAKCVAAPSTTCDAAVGINDARERVGQAIMNNASKLQSVYRELHDASPTSKIYAIGYPQFIQDSSTPCFLNGAFVSASERHFITEAVAQMNAVIKGTAMTENVEYIDIEDSLAGGRLCEGITHDYVTGVRNEFYLTALNSDLLKFLYHPNAAGHEKMAETITAQIGETIFGDVETYENVSLPEYSEYFDASETYGTYVVSDDTIINAVPIQGESITASFEESTYGYTTITVSMFSTPIVLGMTLPNEDGSLEYTFTIPQDIEPGYHTLLFSGTSFSGDLMEIVQTIFIKSSDPDDIDGDGILDAVDPCLFNAICEEQESASEQELEPIVAADTVSSDNFSDKVTFGLDTSGGALSPQRVDNASLVALSANDIQFMAGLDDSSVLGLEYNDDQGGVNESTNASNSIIIMFIVAVVGILVSIILMKVWYAKQNN